MPREPPVTRATLPASGLSCVLRDMAISSLELTVPLGTVKVYGAGDAGQGPSGFFLDDLQRLGYALQSEGFITPSPLVGEGWGGGRRVAENRSRSRMTSEAGSAPFLTLALPHVGEGVIHLGRPLARESRSTGERLGFLLGIQSLLRVVVILRRLPRPQGARDSSTGMTHWTGHRRRSTRARSAPESDCPRQNQGVRSRRCPGVLRSR